MKASSDSLLGGMITLVVILEMNTVCQQQLVWNIEKEADDGGLVIAYPTSARKMVVFPQ